MERMELSTSVGFKIRLLFVSLFSLGLGLVGHLLRSRSWPRLINEKGITLRNGAHFPWTSLTQVGAVIGVDRRGMPLPFDGAWRLSFGDAVVHVNPSTFRKGHEELQLISRLTGRSPKTG